MGQQGSPTLFLNVVGGGERAGPAGQLGVDGPEHWVTDDLIELGRAADGPVNTSAHSKQL